MTMEKKTFEDVSYLLLKMMNFHCHVSFQGVCVIFPDERVELQDEDHKPPKPGRSKISSKAMYP